MQGYVDADVKVVGRGIEELVAIHFEEAEGCGRLGLGAGEVGLVVGEFLRAGDDVGGHGGGVRRLDCTDTVGDEGFPFRAG